MQLLERRISSWTVQDPASGATLSGLWTSATPGSQGSLASSTTLGFEAESRWDSWFEKFKGPKCENFLSRVAIGAAKSALRQNAALEGSAGRFGAVADFEFGQNVFDVELGGVFGETQELADFAIAEAFGHQAQDFQFALSEVE
jgi:hypothetical protein